MAATIAANVVALRIGEDDAGSADSTVDAAGHASTGRVAADVTDAAGAVVGGAAAVVGGAVGGVAGRAGAVARWGTAGLAERLTTLGAGRGAGAVVGAAGADDIGRRKTSVTYR